jgi:hypothetical protein
VELGAHEGAAPLVCRELAAAPFENAPDRGRSRHGHGAQAMPTTSSPVRAFPTHGTFQAWPPSSVSSCPKSLPPRCLVAKDDLSPISPKPASTRLAGGACERTSDVHANSHRPPTRALNFADSLCSSSRRRRDISAKLTGGACCEYRRRWSGASPPDCPEGPDRDLPYRLVVSLGQEQWPETSF